MDLSFRTLSIVAVIVPLAALTGCGKSPKDVCGKYEELVKKESKGEKDEDMKKGRERCEKELTEVKSASPKAWDCISKDCMGKEGLKAFGGCIESCTADDEALKELEKKQKKDRAKEEEKKALAWVDASDKGFDAKLKLIFAEKTVDYSITLKEGFKETKYSSENTRSYEMERPEDDYYPTPNVSVDEAYGEDDPDKVASNYKDDTVLKKEKSDSGFVLHLEGKSGVRVIVQIKQGETKLRCTAEMSSYGDDLIKDNKTTFVPALEKLCKSLKLK